jgi:hypothetical protein
MLVGAALPAPTSGAEAPAIVPREPIVLFNGKDLSGFFFF